MLIIWKHTLLSLYFRERKKLENSTGAFHYLSPDVTHSTCSPVSQAHISHVDQGSPTPGRGLYQATAC